jgi:hypothetical protein
MNVVPHYKTNISGRGIYPDQITPTLQDKIEGKDPELQWILQDVKTIASLLIQQNK